MPAERDEVLTNVGPALPASAGPRSAPCPSRQRDRARCPPKRAVPDRILDHGNRLHGGMKLWSGR